MRTTWLAGLLLGCGDGGEAGLAWWEVPTTEVWTDGNAGEEEGEEDDFGEPEQRFWAELPVGDDAPTGSGEAGIFVVDEAGLRCDGFWEVTRVQAATEPCSACTWSGTLQLGELVLEVDDPSCADFAVLSANTIDVGHSGETAYWRPDSEWVGQGLAELDAEVWFLEFPLPDP